MLNFRKNHNKLTGFAVELANCIYWFCWMDDVPINEICLSFLRGILAGHWDNAYG